MAGTDIAGRAYAKIGSLKAGDKVQVDGDFTCIAAGATLIVQADERGLFVPCAHEDGTHHLAGQEEDDFYIGVYPVVS